MGRASKQQVLLLFAVLFCGSVVYLRTSDAEGTTKPRQPRPTHTDVGDSGGTVPEDATLASRVRKRASFMDGVEPARGVIDVYDTTVPSSTTVPTNAVIGKDSELVEMTLTHRGEPVGRRGRVLIKLDRVVGPPASADYIKQLAQLPGGLTGVHTIFRVEKPTLVQGELSDPRVPMLTGPRGDCPVSIPADYKASYCDCGCHGPIIRPGQIAWAGGGGGGTNFFIFTGDAGQAKLWKHDHTIWGEIIGKEAFETVEAVYKLPVKGSGTHTLIDRVEFTLRYVSNPESVEV